ncbi:molecular chaperone [Planctomycetota bacterium]
MNNTAATEAAATFEESLRSLAAGDLLELAYLQEHEVSEETLRELCAVGFPDSLGVQIDGDKAEQVCQLVRDSLQEIARLLNVDNGKSGRPDEEVESGVSQPTDSRPQNKQELLDELAGDYAAIYLNYSLGVSPCESVWFDEDGLVYQEPMFQVRNIYRHYGLEAEDWRRRSEDHLVLQLLFISHLMGQEGHAPLRDAATFLDEHTLRWIDKFAERVATRCYTSFYGSVALLTAAYLDQLRDCLAEVLGESRPSPEDIEQRLETRAKQEQPAQAECGPLCGPTDGDVPDRRRYP